MAGRKRRAILVDDPVPNIYREMLAEAGPSSARDAQSPPLKRKRPGQRSAPRPAVGTTRTLEDDVQQGDDDEEDGIEFEDVSLPSPTLQTITRDSDEEEEEDDDDYGDIRFDDVTAVSTESSPVPPSDQPRELDLNLSAQRAAMITRRSADRRKPVTKEEKLRRVEVHKVHLLCFLSHVALRNHWCNSREVQDALRPLLSEKMTKYLNPGTHLSQFGRTESLKNGLQQASDMFRIKFAVTERGIRRALWAENEQQLQDVQSST